MTFPIPHAGLVHMPLALALIIPLMYAMSWLSVRKGWLGNNVWYGVVIFSVLQVLSIAVGLESGEAAEFTASAAKDAVEAHEHMAEKFLQVWGVLGVLLVTVPFTRGRRWEMYADSAAVLLFVVQAYLAFETGHLGGELISR